MGGLFGCIARWSTDRLLAVVVNDGLWRWRHGELWRRVVWLMTYLLAAAKTETW